LTKGKPTGGKSEAIERRAGLSKKGNLPRAQKKWLRESLKAKTTRGAQKSLRKAVYRPVRVFFFLFNGGVGALGGVNQSATGNKNLIIGYDCLGKRLGST